MAEKQQTRREVLKKAIYVAPAILTLPAMLSIASAGSGYGDGRRYKRKGQGGEGED